MKTKLTLLTIMLCLLSTSAYAQLKPWADFDISDEVWSITTVKVHSNMGNDYLEGLRETWVASNKIAVELGQIEDFAIYRSELPESGDFNLFLVVKFSNSAQLEPNKEAYDKFMKAWGEANEEKTRAIVKDYPGMRDITGEYQVRKITVK